MKHFSASYTDFVKYNRKPNEDFHLASSKMPIFIIADGVTQGRFESGVYAFPAGAKAAAQIFCYTILEFLEKGIDLSKKKNHQFNKNLVKKSFNLANQRVYELNKNEGIYEKMNLFEYDLFDTVGVVGFVLDDSLYYGFVGDCGLIIFNKSNKVKFQTKDMVKPAVEKAKVIHKDWKNLSEKQQIIIEHRDFRNTPDKKGYGSFSGEKEVEKYYQIDKKALKKGDLFVFYSDGFVDYFQFPGFIEILRNKNKKSLDKFTLEKARLDNSKYGSDRTLISIIC